MVYVPSSCSAEEAVTMGSTNTSTTREGSGGGGGRLHPVLLVSLLLVTVPLVGCAQDGGGGGAVGGGDGMTEADGLEAAEPIAEEWSAEAVLIGAATIETTGEGPEQWPSQAPEFRSDDAVGDGLAPQWGYTFKDGEERIVVYVREDGETYQGPEPQEDAFMDAELENWELDSTDAVETAREEDGNFSATIEADDAEVGYFLVGGEDGNETWVLDVQSATEEEQVTLVVDAHSGEVQRFGTRG